MKTLNVLFILIIHVLSSLSIVHAGEGNEVAHIDLMIGPRGSAGKGLVLCKKTAEGLVIASTILPTDSEDTNSEDLEGGSLEVTNNAVNMSTNLVKGSPCLSAMTQLPASSRVEGSLLNIPTGVEVGADTTIDECLLWVFNNNGPGAVICDVNPSTEALETKFVLGDSGYPLQAGESCHVTLNALNVLAPNSKYSHPIAIGLGPNDEGFAVRKDGTQTMEYIECAMDEENNLVTTYREHSDMGVMAPGEDCLVAMSEGSESVKTSAPVSAGGDVALVGFGTFAVKERAERR